MHSSKLDEERDGEPMDPWPWRDDGYHTLPLHFCRRGVNHEPTNHRLRRAGARAARVNSPTRRALDDAGERALWQKPNSGRAAGVWQAHRTHTAARALLHDQMDAGAGPACRGGAWPIGRSSTTLAGAGVVGFDKQPTTKVWHVALAATGQTPHDKRSTPP
jgi:hypothetical protein